MQKNRHLQFIAEWFSNKSMSSAVSPNILPIKPALSIVLVQFIGRTIITKKTDSMEEKYLFDN